MKRRRPRARRAGPSEYKVVRVEAGPKPHEGQLICPPCGGPLNARQGRFALNYFLVGGSKRNPLAAPQMAPRLKVTKKTQPMITVPLAGIVPQRLEVLAGPARPGPFFLARLRATAT
jgi:hypothetical protein